MNELDKKRFMAALNGLGIAFKITVTDEQLRLFWSMFNEYSIDEFERACFQFLKRGKFFPAPSELLELIPSSKAKEHVSADEAWAIVMASMDEYETVVMTKEIAEARGIALDVYNNGDKIGARMAFKDAYTRIISTAQEANWFVSRGFDKSRVESAVQKALQLGRLTQDDAAKYIEHKPQTTFKALVDESVKRVSAPRVPVEDIIKKIEEDDFQAGIATREKARAEFEARRAENIKRLEELKKKLDDK